MKGVILAGGTGSRLRPLTAVVNKHLLPVGAYPMIFYPIASLAQAGIQEILIVSGGEDLGGLARLLGSGADLNLHFSFRVQDGPTGIAGALFLAETFAQGEPLVVLLGDNIFLEDLTPSLKEFLGKGSGAEVFLKEVPDPQQYGVAVLEGGKIAAIQEKPSQPISSLCVTGIYYYDSLVFDIIRGLSPSSRGELEITDVNRAYLQQGRLKHHLLSTWWIDAGTCSSLLAAGEYLKNRRLPLFEEAEGCH